MKLVQCLGLCVVVFFVSGCGGHGPPPPESKDPATYAATIKQRVDDLVAEGLNDPNTAPKEAAVLLESLEGYKSQPVGEHDATYAALLERCRELSTAKGADIRRKLDELSTLAKKLPARK